MLAAFLLAGLVGVILNLPPANRGWAPEFERTPTADFNADGSVTLRNVRDWTYVGAGGGSRAWRDLTVDPRSITGASFLLEPFSQLRAAGHTFLSFQFRDGSALSFSIEAKLRAGQTYSVALGVLPIYGLAFQWGTERDFVTRRLIYLRHRLRLYPLTIGPRLAGALFRDAAEETNRLARRPRHYNSLTENCTNELAYIVNRHAPHTLPWNPAWHLPGYADEYLMRQGYIAIEGGSVERTRAARDLTPHRAAVEAIAGAPPSAFSVGLRALLSRPPGRAAS